MKCCLPPYDGLLPECIDLGERSRQREENKCDDGLEKCVEVKMLMDLRDDTVGTYPTDEGSEDGTSDTEANNKEESVPDDADKDPFEPEITEHHINIVDGDDDGYAYSAHIGGREGDGEKPFGYKKKEEFHKEDHFTARPKTSNIKKDTNSATGGFYGMQVLWLTSAGVLGFALLVLDW